MIGMCMMYKEQNGTGQIDLWRESRDLNLNRKRLPNIMPESS